MSWDDRNSCDFREATHVLLLDGSVERIATKRGIREDGSLEPRFSMTTESGKSVSMTEARLYFNRSEE